MPDGFSFDEALKPSDDEGFSFEEALKPKKTNRLAGLAENARNISSDMSEAVKPFGTLAGRVKEDISTGYADKPGYTYGNKLPFRQNDQTGEIEWGYAPEAARQLLRDAQMDPMKFNINDPEQRRALTRVAAATMGLNRTPAGIIAPGAAAGPVPRTEPPPVGVPPAISGPGASLEEAGITPIPEPPPGGGPKPGSAPLSEAGIVPTPEPGVPAPATETETVAVPQADGTVKQVQVQTGEPPPPNEPPPAAEPVVSSPEDLRAAFPGLSDEQFEALFRQASQEVPRPTSTEPAAQQAWGKAILATMGRLAVAAVPQPQTQAQAGPWAPVAEEPAPSPFQKLDTVGHVGPWEPVGKNHLGDTVYQSANGVRAIMDGGVPSTEATKENAQGQRVPKNPDKRKKLYQTTEEAAEASSAAEAPAAEQPPPTKPTDTDKSEPVAEAPKSEWTLLGKNADGDDVYTNANGVHSTLVDGIRSVEPVRLRPTKGGMEMSVPAPADKDPEYQVVTPAAAAAAPTDEKKDEPKQPVASAEPPQETAPPKPAESAAVDRTLGSSRA
jgi:hypothetical protein